MKLYLKLCKDAKDSKEHYVWTEERIENTVETKKSELNFHSCLSYCAQEEENSPFIFIVAYKETQLKFNESKLKFLSSMGMLI